jgi:hypothetical protein
MIRFLISFFILFSAMPRYTAAVVDTAPAERAISVLQESRKKETASASVRYTIPSSVLVRRHTAGTFIPAPPAHVSIKYSAPTHFEFRAGKLCSKASILQHRARLLTFFVFPQRAALHPRHVYW